VRLVQRLIELRKENWQPLSLARSCVQEVSRRKPVAKKRIFLVTFRRGGDSNGRSGALIWSNLIPAILYLPPAEIRFLLVASCTQECASAIRSKAKA